MNLICALPVLLLAIIPVYTQKIVDGVYELTQADFGPFIESNDHVLVEFYTPWCVHCKVLYPEYVKAAKILADKGSPVKLGKVNSSAEVDLSQRCGIRGFPTLLLFRKGTLIKYEHERVAEHMVAWLERKSGYPAKVLTTALNVTKVIENNNIVIVGFFNNLTAEETQIFLEVADNLYESTFAICTNEEIFKQFEASNNVIILFNKVDDRKTRFKQKLNSENLEIFIYFESLPILIELMDSNGGEFLNPENRNLFVTFLKPNYTNTKEIRDILRLVAKDFKPKILFFIVIVTEGSLKITNFLKVKPEDVPVSFLVERKTKSEKMITKYRLSFDKLTENMVRTFNQNYLDNKLKPYFRCQDLPSNWNTTSVYTLVQSNFDNVVFDKTKHVLVDFYTPWCHYCKILEPIYAELSSSFTRKDFIFAKIDLEGNELENVQVDGFPTLRVYPKTEKAGIQYAGPYTVNDIRRFIWKACKIGIIIEDYDYY